MQNTPEQIPLLYRSRKARIALAGCGLLLSHLVAFYAGGEVMRSSILRNIETMSDQVDEFFQEPQSWEPQSRVSETGNDLDGTAPKQADDAEAGFCWEGEPCESDTHPGVFYVHIRADNSGVAVWPLPPADDCTANEGYVCTDAATGFHYSYWKGMYSWFNPQAEAMGLEPYSEQFMSDSAGLAQN